MPFDLSRLATHWGEGNKGDWSLAFTEPWKNPKTGRVAPNPKRPRIVVDAQNSKMAFIKLGSILLAGWPKGARFLDLRTLRWALRNKSFSLKRACKAFRVRGKVDHKPTGRITPEEIEYCRGDVAATHRLLNAMMREFNLNPIDLRPDQAYSPASIAKGYLDVMRIKKPKAHFRDPVGLPPILLNMSTFSGRTGTQNNSCRQGNGSKLGAWWRPALAGSPTSHTGTAKEYVRG